MSESVETHEIQKREDTSRIMGFLCTKYDIRENLLLSNKLLQSNSELQTSIWVSKDLKFQLPDNRFDVMFSNTTGCITLYCESENINHSKSDISDYQQNFHLKGTTRAIEIIAKKLPDSEFTYPPNVKIIGN